MSSQSSLTLESATPPHSPCPACAPAQRQTPGDSHVYVRPCAQYAPGPGPPLGL